MMTTIISIYNTTNKFNEEYNLRYMIKKFNLIDCNLNYGNLNGITNTNNDHNDYNDYNKYRKNHYYYLDEYDNNNFKDYYDADDERTTNE
jgi:hypothetical protein